MPRVSILCWTLLTIGCGFFLGTAWATKPTIPFDDLVRRSSLVAIADIVSVRELAKPELDAEGNWKQVRKRVSARVSEVLKAQLSHDLEFDMGPLTLEPGQSFIVFLRDQMITLDDEYGRRKGIAFDFIEPPTRRIEATDANVEEVKNVIKRQR